MCQPWARQYTGFYKEMQKKEKYHWYFKTKVMLLTYQLLLLSHYIMSSSFLEPMDCSLPETSVCGISLYSQEYRIGLSFPSPQDLPNPGIELTCVSWLAGLFFVAESLGNPYISVCSLKINVCKHKLLSPTWLFATPWTAAHQAPLSMRFSRQGYWSGLPFPKNNVRL